MIDGKPWRVELVHGRLHRDGRVGECDYEARAIRAAFRLVVFMFGGLLRFGSPAS